MFKKFIATTFLIVFSTVLITKIVPMGFPVFAQEEQEEQEEDLEELTDEIEELEEKVAELQGQEKTLQNEIAYYDGQINLTQLRIQNAIAEINKRTEILGNLKEDIGELEYRIEEMSESIDYQEEILDERMRARYKSQSLSPVLYMLNSDSFSNAIRRVKYLKTLQYNDQKLLDEMRRAKDAYNQQKGILETKKDETEELKQKVENEKASLVAYRATLDNQKIAKQSLLEQTRNDEARYQELLAEARRELSQIVQAASALQGTEPKNVDEGEIIGIQGNTGYSFGDHLHFGVYKYDDIDDIAGGWDWYNSNTVDPEDVLENKSVFWNTGCSAAGNRNTGNGDWEWPMSNITISQGYGDTCWTWMYNGKPHPAYDMYGAGGSVVKAVADGKAYFCRNCLGDGGNGVFIFHDDYMTLYWHLQ